MVSDQVIFTPDLLQRVDSIYIIQLFDLSIPS
jgi:hypothetical protein